MRTLKLLTLSIILSSALQAVETDPVGAIRVTALGNSDTILGVPFHRTPVFEGRIYSISSNVLTVSGAPDWTANEFVYNGDSVIDTYYVLIGSGTKEGSYFTVDANTGDTLTLDLNGDNMTGVQTVQADGSGDIIRIIPYWTLNTVFPDGEGLHASSNPLSRNSEIFIPSQNIAGTNIAAPVTYFYYQGELLQGTGFYEFGNFTQTVENTPLYPDTFFIVRHNINTDTELIFSGSVQMSGFSVPLNILEENTPQDNYVFLNVPVDMSLSDSNLYESGAFSGSSNPLSRIDELFIFNNSQVAQNKAAGDTYFYYTGELLQGEGWYKFGDFSRLANDDKVLKAGEGIIIRKGASATPSTTDWNAIPSYLQ